MKPWETVGIALTPDGTELKLLSHPTEFLILIGGERLMSSRMHGSEEALATVGCAHARTLSKPRVLVGGLGMGFTLRAALDVLPADAEVIVSELVPAVVEWNRGPLGPLANHPLNDPRVRVEARDVALTMRANPGRFDAVLLDTDNGPNVLAAASNATLYDGQGASLARTSLKPGGVFAVWSVSDDRRFSRALRAVGFTVRLERVRARVTKGGKHTLFIAQRGE